MNRITDTAPQTAAPAELLQAELKPPISLTEAQRLRMEAIASEYAALFHQCGATDPIRKAMHDTVAAFVGGGMELDRAIDTLSVTLSLTREKLFGAEPRQ